MALRTKTVAMPRKPPRTIDSARISVGFFHKQTAFERYYSLQL